MKKLLCSILFCMTLQMAMATEYPIFRTLDVRTGLSDNYVKDILRDQYGFMWLATSNGLNRYDGYQFKKYTITQLGNYNDDIMRIMEDGDGTLWIQTIEHTYIYNRALDRITDEAQQLLNNFGITGSYKRIFTDEDKNLWVNTDKMLFRYNFEQKKLSTIAHVSAGDIVDLTVRRDRAYVLTQNGDFYRVDIANGIMKYEGHFNFLSTSWHQLYLDSQGWLWFFSAHSPNDGLNRYDTSTRQWDNHPILGTFQHTILVSMLDDGIGNMWIGTENEGIYLLDTNSMQLTKLARSNNSQFSLPSNHISCFFKDLQDVIWIGTSKWGAAYADLTPHSFELTRLQGNEDISCIAEDSKGNLWIGFDGEGIAMMTMTGSLTYYNKAKGNLASNLVTCSLTDHAGRLWIGTYGDGILYFDGRQFVKYQTAGAAATFMRCMAEDEYGNLWLGTINNGIVCLCSDGTTAHYTMDNSVLRTSSITSLHCDNHNNLYVGTSTGFYVFDIKAKAFREQNSSTQKLTDDFITSLDKDERGLVWIGTRTGLKIYDEARDTLFSLTEEDGLSNNFVRAVLGDRELNMWVSTDNGLTFVKTTKSDDGGYSFVCIPFFEEDGLEKAAFNNDAVCLTSTGVCLIGSNNGLIRIKNNLLPTDYPLTHIMFTALIVGNQPIEVGDKSGILNRNLQLSNSITLSYDQNNISIDVSAMNYNKKHKIHYLYRLREVNDRWIALPGNRINFNALAPGTYTLEVKATDLGGWTSEPSVLCIHVKPPFWRSMSAYICYLLLIIIGVYLYLRQLQKKHQRMLAQQKLEMELEQQYLMEANKMRFFTNISHDLKTPLSLIITPLEKLLAGQLEKSIRVELDLVWRNARMLMDEVTQLLDMRKLDAGNEKLHLSHGDFIEFLRKIVESFKYYAESRGVVMNLKINSPSIEMDFDQSKMRRVVMNMLSNAFKYNSVRGSISVTVGREGQNMVLQIADTGIGIKDENKHRIFDRFYQESNDTEYIGSGIGLHIVKEYVAMHQGEIAVADNHPQGTVFTITIPVGNTHAESNSIVPTGASDVKGEIVKPEDKTTILIVEDNHDFCMFLERCLNDQYHVLTAANGKDALEVLAVSHVNIVISDIMMPEMNGLELCNRIKTDISFSHIPVILLTAKSTEDNIITGLKDGADDYITKPFNLSILKLRIQKILEWTANSHRAFSEKPEIAPSEITVSSLDEELIEKAIKAVEEQMNNSEFSVEEFGAAVGLSRGHLYKKLMAITGKSPIEFIRTIRIKRGKALLDQGRTNISEVAYTVGFSPKQFSKYFKDEYGCLPSEYIRK